ncbi:Haloalkane dehalogenase [Gracilariopsis chorda]|uniref:Haloalkane dehalogenase n=1 Tax=Gracilariopsis chorda TaxID=448386 RepID=A0A2V3IG67_9FLOR|nr:Haloalkane dehalogenase [Gracilariopsis chorda]|eukprot:PXF41079.1 Haloalkane dehalogenase [Gracilariopsis chorda]
MVYGTEIRTTPEGIRFVRTPSSRFSNITDFDMTTRYAIVSGLRMAYTDTGYAKHGTILLLHGEPDWAYLYRFMIPVFVRSGYRVIAPDLIGFGRSDKPINRSAYTYDSHVKWVKMFLRKLNLKGLHSFLQDWGGMISLTIAAEEGWRFDRLVIANTILPDGSGIDNFLEWRNFSQSVPVFSAGQIINCVTPQGLSDAEIAAYNAPFPSELYQAGVRQFPMIVPLTPRDVGVERFIRVRERMSKWKKPVLLMWGLRDTVLTERFYRDFSQLIPGTDGQPHTLYAEAGHFLQEDVGPYIADAMVRWLEDSGATPSCPSSSFMRRDVNKSRDQQCFVPEALSSVSRRAHAAYQG